MDFADLTKAMAEQVKHKQEQEAAERAKSRECSPQAAETSCRQPVEVL